jgi:hypothetical protein
LAELELEKVRQELHALRNELNNKEKTNADLVRQLEEAHSNSIRSRTELSTYKDRVNGNLLKIQSLVHCLTSIILVVGKSQ